MRWPIQYTPSDSCTLKCLFFPTAFRETEKSLGWKIKRVVDTVRNKRERQKKNNIMKFKIIMFYASRWHYFITFKILGLHLLSCSMEILNLNEIKKVKKSLLFLIQ